MPLNINRDWLNLNGQRRYPLAGDATRVDLTAGFTIPDDFLVELQLPVHAGLDVDPGRFFVLGVGAYASGYSLTVGYQPATGGAVAAATALVPAAGFARNGVYALGGIAPFDDTFGKVVIGRLDSIALQPPGSWTFDLDATRLDPDAIRPIIRGVSSLVAVNGAQRSVRLQGDVALIAGANCQLDVVEADGQDPLVVVNFLEGAGTVTPCECAGDVSQPVPIATINGLGPDASGAFSIVGSDCLQVQAIPGGVRLVDVCSKPCCGCAELDQIVQTLRQLDQQRATVQEFVSRLQVAVDTMDQIVLGARLNDRSCFAGI